MLRVQGGAGTIACVAALFAAIACGDGSSTSPNTGGTMGSAGRGGGGADAASGSGGGGNAGSGGAGAAGTGAAGTGASGAGGGDADAPDGDAGTPDGDADTPDADAGAADADAGTPDADAGTPDADADTPDSDATTDAGDAGADGSDAGDADASHSGVVGRAVDTYVMASGNITQPVDLSKYILMAFVYDAGTRSFAVHSPVIETGGAFRFPTLPAGAEYYLRFHDASAPPAYFVTSARNIDLGRFLLGRPNVQSAKPGTTMVFNLTGLQAWQDGDYLDAICTNVASGMWGMDWVASTNWPTPGDEQVSGMTVDYRANAGVPNLIDGSQGDRMQVMQLVKRSTATTPYASVAKAVELPAFSLADGQTTTVSGRLEDVTQQPMDVDVKLSQFHSTWGAENPAGEIVSASFSIWVQPDVQRGLIGSSPDLVRMIAENLDDWAASMTYGNPYPSSYGTAVLVRSGFAREFKIGSANPVRLFGGTELMLTAARTQTLVPLIGPVRNLQVGGSDAKVDVTSAGTQPTVQWTAPAFGTPTFYQVHISRIFEREGAMQRETIGRLRTSGTSVVVPPGTLTAGNRYALVVTAFSQGISFASNPLATGLPHGRTDVISGLIAP